MVEKVDSNLGENSNVIPFISEEILRESLDFLQDQNNELSPEDRTEKELDLAKILQSIYKYSIENKDGAIYVVTKTREGVKNLIVRCSVVRKVERILGDYSIAS